MKIKLSILFLIVALTGQTQSKYDHPFLKRKPGLMRFYTGINAPTEKTPDKFDRFNTDFFWNSWIGDQNDVVTKIYSIGNNLNIMFDIPFSKKSRFGIAIGLGYGHFNIRHNGSLNYIDNPTGGGEHTYLAPYIGAKRWINRTTLDIVEIPFEFRIRARQERKKYKFYPGFKVGYIFQNYSKWRIDNLEFKDFNFPDLNRLHYGPTLRIGVDNYFLFGYYDLTYLFTDQNSSKLQLYAIGISIGWF